MPMNAACNCAILLRTAPKDRDRGHDGERVHPRLAVGTSEQSSTGPHPRHDCLMIAILLSVERLPHPRRSVDAAGI
jgi:hypothetical protein